jgi:putative PIN family toxin of toxin-antitoxin system
VISEVIVSEFSRILKAKLKVPQERVNTALAVFDSADLLPKPEAPADVELRDPDDKWVVATAFAGHADVLVSGDRDVLALEDPDGLKVMSPRQFWEYLRQGDT